jgi:hypothetical protein
MATSKQGVPMTSPSGLDTVQSLRALGLTLSDSVWMVRHARDGGHPHADGIQVAYSGGQYTIGDFDPRKAS